MLKLLLTVRILTLFTLVYTMVQILQHKRGKMFSVTENGGEGKKIKRIIPSLHYPTKLLNSKNRKMGQQILSELNSGASSFTNFKINI